MKSHTGSQKLQKMLLAGIGFLIAGISQNAEAAASLSRVDVNPYTISGGASATLSVQMTEPCPAGGCLVNLYTNDTLRLPVPSQILVPQGALSASVGLTAGRAATGMEVIIQASYAGVFRATYPWVLAAQTGAELQPISMNATNFVYSGKTLSLTFSVSEACPSGGCSLSLYSTSKLIPLPSTFVIPAGMTQGTLNVTVGSTSYPVPVSFDASYNNTSARSPSDFAVFAPLSARAADGSYSMLGFGSSNRSGYGGTTATTNDFMARSNMNHNINTYVYRQCKAIYPNGEITAPAAPVRKGEYIDANGNRVYEYSQTIKCSSASVNGHLRNMTENSSSSMYVGTSFSVQICLQAPISKSSVVALKTRNGGITVPTSVTIPAGAQCANFTARASSGATTRIQGILNNIMIEGKIITVYNR